LGYNMGAEFDAAPLGASSFAVLETF